MSSGNPPCLAKATPPDITLGVRASLYEWRWQWRDHNSVHGRWEEKAFPRRSPQSSFLGEVREKGREDLEDVVRERASTGKDPAKGESQLCVRGPGGGAQCVGETEEESQESGRRPVHTPGGPHEGVQAVL